MIEDTTNQLYDSVKSSGVEQYVNSFHNILFTFIQLLHMKLDINPIGIVAQSYLVFPRNILKHIDIYENMFSICMKYVRSISNNTFIMIMLVKLTMSTSRIYHMFCCS